MSRIQAVRRALVAVAAVVAIATAALTVAGSAEAAPPQKIAFDEAWNDVQHCAGFDITYYGRRDFSGMLQFDSAGNRKGAVLQQNGWEVDTNLTTGKSITIGGGGLFKVDFVAENVKETGSWTASVAGQGVVFHENGFLLRTYDDVIRIAGPHDDPDVTLCAVLG